MIVVGGESLIDLMPAYSTMDGELAEITPRVGGSPFNTAVAVGRLGADVSFLSRVSTDAFGSAIVDRLRRSNVDISLLQRGAELSTLASVAIGTDGAARYSFYIENTADRLVADPGVLPDRVGVLALASFGLVLEPGASAYEAVLRRQAELGTLTVLDPNIRADLIGDPDAYRRRFLGWLPLIRVLKASEEDLAWLVPGQDPQVTAVEWLRAGPAAVVLTKGENGLVAFTRTSEPVRVPAERVAVADTIGAGDTVHAALLVRLAETGLRSAADLDGLGAQWWRETLRYAAGAASVTVSRIGAQPPWSAELPTL